MSQIVYCDCGSTKPGIFEHRQTPSGGYYIMPSYLCPECKNHRNLLGATTYKETPVQELEVLRSRSPELARFLEDWKKKYEDKSFQLEDQKQQADFYEGIQEMARCILASSQNVSMKVLTNVDGVNTLYIHAVPNKSNVM
jgi:hypothetical protein